MGGGAASQEGRGKLMAVWALLKDGREVAAFRSIRNDIAREDCEAEALAVGLAFMLPAGLALARGVEIVCLQDDD